MIKIKFIKTFDLFIDFICAHALSQTNTHNQKAIKKKY